MKFSYIIIAIALVIIVGYKIVIPAEFGPSFGPSFESVLKAPPNPPVLTEERIIFTNDPTIFTNDGSIIIK